MSLPITKTDFGDRVGSVEFYWAQNSKEFLFANSVLIHGQNAVIVDPSAVFTPIEALAHTRYVKMVLNTHYHGDHRALNHLFKDVIFAAPELDASFISDFEEYISTAVDSHHTYYRDWLRTIFTQYKIIDCPVSLKLKDGDKIETGEEEISVMHLPGHTPGHSGLFFKEADLLFVSDIDLTPYGPWYAANVSDLKLFRESIQRVRDFECTYYVPSHGERIYDREQFLIKLDKYESHFVRRDEKILKVLEDGPKTLDQIASWPVIYKAIALSSDPLKAYFQYKMVGKHLDVLVEQGRVLLDEEGVYHVDKS